MTTTEYFQKKICRGEPTYDFLHDPGNAFFNLLVNGWIKKNDTEKISFVE